MAAGGSSSNVVVGPGRIYFAPLGTAEPASCSAALPSAWLSVGYTEDGSQVEIGQTSAEVEVAEELDPVRYVNVKRTTKVTFAMAEMTVRNLALAMAAGAGRANSTASFEPPDSGTDTAVMLVWDSMDTPDATNERWLFRQAKATGNISIARKKSPAKSTIPVEFNCERPSAAKSWLVFPNSSFLV